MELSIKQKECINTISALYKTGQQIITIAGPAGSGKAQPIDTIIPTPEGEKRIGDLKIGDYVYSFNLDANSLELKKVTNSIISQTLETYIMTIGNKTFEVTPRHQLYIIDKGWTRAYDVKIGDKMLDANGKEIIINNIVNKKYGTPIKTYNLTIEGNNNYFVTDIQVLVHNVGSDTWNYDDTELLN